MTCRQPRKPTRWPPYFSTARPRATSSGVRVGAEAWPRARERTATVSMPCVLRSSPRAAASADERHLDAALHDDLHRRLDVADARVVVAGDDLVRLDAGRVGRRGVAVLLHLQQEVEGLRPVDAVGLEDVA